MTYLLNYMLVPLYYLFLRIFSKNRKNTNTIFFLIVSVHAILFRALADPYNYPDGEVYIIAYKDISKWSLNETIFTINHLTEWGPGYLLWNWIITRISPTHELFFILTSIISVGGVMWFYKKTSYALLTTVMIYLLYPMLYCQGFYVLRQHLAVVFVLMALLEYDNNKKFLTMSLIASVIHTSAIIIFPFFFWKKISLKSYTSFRVVVYILAGVVFMRILIQGTISLLPRYQAVYQSTESNSNIIPILVLGSMVLMFALMGVFKKINSRKDKMIASFLVYGLMIALFSFKLPGVGRLTMYFLYICPVAITFLYKYSKNRLLSISYFLLFMMVTSSMVYISTKENEYDYVLYWENEKNSN